MANKKSSATENNKTSPAKHEERRSLRIALRGIEDSRAYAQLMSAIMTDLIAGTLSPQIANATCNAAGKLLKVHELQMKYGAAGKPKEFPLIGVR